VRVGAALGAHDDLLVVTLDVTSLDDARNAGRAAVDRFGRIDLLVNDAGNFYAGFFEEISPADFRAQVDTNLFGPMNVTRAVLPVMRARARGSSYAEPSIDDYAERTTRTVTAWNSMNGKQGATPPSSPRRWASWQYPRWCTPRSTASSSSWCPPL